MIPGPPKLVICPFCGAMKELMTLASGNTIDTIYWSDLKVFAPMLPQVSPVQKCPHCGMYYLEHKQTSLMGCGRGSLECGKLNYPEWKEAYHQFCNQADIVKSTKWWKILLKSNKCRIANEKEMMNIKLWLIQAYNDYYRYSYYRKRYRQDETNARMPSCEEKKFIVALIHEFVKSYDWSNPHKLLLKAELYREANNMEKCSEVLSSISTVEMTDFEKNVYVGIKERMKKGDTRVFIINEE